MEYPESDDLTDDAEVVAHRAQAAAKLDQIVRQTKQALIDAGIDRFGWQAVGLLLGADAPNFGHSLPARTTGRCSFHRFMDLLLNDLRSLLDPRRPSADRRRANACCT